MAKQYTTEQFWQVYETLPEEIKNALWAPETGENIADIITKNGLDQHHDLIVDLCGQVFIGLTLPQELTGELEKLGIPPDTAKMTAQQLNGLVFYPIKPGLEKLHRPVGEKAIEKQELGIPTPRHSERVWAPEQTAEQAEGQDEYVVRQEPSSAEATAGEGKETREVFMEEQEREDLYREKAE